MISDLHVAGALVVGLETVGDVAEAIGVVLEHDGSKDDVVFGVGLVVQFSSLQAEQPSGRDHVPLAGQIDLHDALGMPGAKVLAATGFDGGESD